MVDVLRAMWRRLNVFAVIRTARARRERERVVALIPHDSLVVVSAGMGRSGSTWQFNIVQRILRELGHEDIGGGWIDDLPSFANHKVVLVKSHAYDEALAERADLVFTSYRDLRDALASSWRCFKRSPAVEHARNSIYHFERWASTAAYVMRYEDLLSRGKVAVADDIVRAFLAADQGVTRDEVTDVRGIDPAKIVADVESLKPAKGEGEGRPDARTLLHPNHITDGRHGQWSEIPAEVVAGIERELRRWMEAKAYLRRTRRIDTRGGESFAGSRRAA